MQTMNCDLMRLSQISIGTSDDQFLVRRNLENINQKASLSLGKLENLNFNLDIKKYYAGASTVS